MFEFLKKWFDDDSLESRKAKAVAQDKAVREHMSQKDYDRNVKSSMHNSDPITKY